MVNTTAGIGPENLEGRGKEGRKRNAKGVVEQADIRRTSATSRLQLIKREKKAWRGDT